MTSELSVIICTHNPRTAYLRKVLDALNAQTLPLDCWELLLIDNASAETLAGSWDLSWHPAARHVREEQLGLTHARLRGIRESKADLLLFVDDDNVLAPDFLEAALGISARWPQIGVWGGRVQPSFDATPPEWTRPYWSWLGIREFERDKWSNLHDWNALPCGAGMSVRRTVAETYFRNVAEDPHRASLDRKGDRLTGSGDIDLAFTACDMGFGTGQFTSLHLSHLIPGSRLEFEYLTRLAQGNGYSWVILTASRTGKSSFSALGMLKRALRACVLTSRERRVEFAKLRGEWDAHQTLRKSPVRSGPPVTGTH